jgi:hypothetical protein
MHTREHTPAPTRAMDKGLKFVEAFCALLASIFALFPAFLVGPAVGRLDGTRNVAPIICKRQETASLKFRLCNFFRYRFAGLEPCRECLALRSRWFVAFAWSEERRRRGRPSLWPKPALGRDPLLCRVRMTGQRIVRIMGFRRRARRRRKLRSRGHSWAYPIGVTFRSGSIP